MQAREGQTIDDAVDVTQPFSDSEIPTNELLNKQYLAWLSDLYVEFSQDDCAAVSAAEALLVAEDDAAAVAAAEAAAIAAAEAAAAEEAEETSDDESESDEDESDEESDEENGGSVEEATDALYADRTKELCDAKKGCFSGEDGDKDNRCITHNDDCEFCANWGKCVDEADKAMCDIEEEDTVKVGLVIGLILGILNGIAIGIIVYVCCCGKNRKCCKPKKAKTEDKK